MSDVDGLPKLLRQLRRIGDLERGRALRRSLRAAIKPALERAKASIPVGVDTHRTYKGREVQPGFARKNIRAVVSIARDKQSGAAILGIKNEAFYAVSFVEVGTSKAQAQPWLRPAFASTESQQTAALSTELRKAITDAARAP